MKQWHVIWMPKGYQGSVLKIIRKFFKKDDILFAPIYKEKCKTKIVERFLYPGYLFVFCEWSAALERNVACRSEGAEFLRDPSGDLATISEEEIMRIHSEEVTFNKDEELNIQFEPGNMVIIRSGPLQGMTGAIEEIIESFVYVNVGFKNAPIKLPFAPGDVELI